MAALDAERFLATLEGHPGTALTANRVGQHPVRSRRVASDVPDRPRWIDLVDPTEEELRASAAGRHRADGARGAARAARARRRAAAAHRARTATTSSASSCSRSRSSDEDRVYYQEIDFVATVDAARHGLEDAAGRAAVRPGAGQGGVPAATRTSGMFVYHLVDEIAEGFLDVVDDLDEEIDELEDHRPERQPGEVGRSSARAPPRPARHPPHAQPDARRRAQDRRQPRRARTAPSCSRATSRSRFDDAFDKLLRASEGLEPRATRSPASATTCRGRSRTTRTR